MLTTDQLLDAIKATHDLPSDYKLAHVLGVQKAAISSYRKGRTHPDQEICQRIAALLGIDPDVVVCSVHAERASTAESRAQWERIAARLVASAGAAAAVVLSVTFSQPSQAADSLSIGVAGRQVDSTAKDTSWQVCSLQIRSTVAGIMAFLRRFFPDPEALAIV